MNFITRNKQQQQQQQQASSSSSSLEEKESSSASSTMKEEKPSSSGFLSKPTKLFTNNNSGSSSGNKDLITTITVPLTPAATTLPLSSAVAGTVGSATASVTTSSSSPFHHHHYQSTPNFNHQSFVLPSINPTVGSAATNRQPPPTAASSNAPPPPSSGFSLALPIPSNTAGSSSSAAGGFSSSFSSLINKNKDVGGGARDIRNRLNDAKAFLDSETSIGGGLNTTTNTGGTRFTLSETPLVNPRPSLLCPINQPSSSSSSPGFSSTIETSANNNNSSSTPTLRLGKDRLKPFDFRSELSRQTPQQSFSDTHSASSTPLFNMSDRYPTSSASSGSGAGGGTGSEMSNTSNPVNLLNLPISSRSSSASSVSLSSSTSSLAPMGRLEAASSDKFREIIANAGYLLIENKRVKTSMDDLSPICELGSGTCGHVIKMRHNPTGYVMAVKQMSISGIVEENKRILMDLEIVLKSNDCHDIVKCLGYLISVSDVWICMELMTMCFDKLLKQIKAPIPEPILGKLTVSTLNALNYLKEQHNVIHRDIKPSNILIDSKSGDIKLCDFGISGNLINSNAFSRSNAGCAGYMAPERIDPVDPQNPSYDIRADVWSLGITLVELATGEYPYKNCLTEFEVMTTILTSEAPQLVGERFSADFKAFVNRCLTKDVGKRPKYAALLNDPFILAYKQQQNDAVDVKAWFHSVVPTAAVNNTSEDSSESKQHQRTKSVGAAATASDTLVVSDEDGRSTRSLTPINTAFNNLAIS